MCNLPKNVFKSKHMESSLHKRHQLSYVSKTKNIFFKIKVGFFQKESKYMTDLMNFNVSIAKTSYLMILVIYKYSKPHIVVGETLVLFAVKKIVRRILRDKVAKR